MTWRTKLIGFKIFRSLHFFAFCSVFSSQFLVAAPIQNEELSAEIDSIIDHSLCAEAREFILDRNINSLIHIEDYQVKIKSLELLGFHRVCEGNIDSAIMCYRNAYKVGVSQQAAEFVVNNLKQLGFLFQSAGNMDSSTFYFKKGLIAGASLGDSLIIGSCQMGIGINQQQQGKIDSALLSYYQTLNVAESINNIGLIIAAKLNISTVYYDHQPEKLRFRDFREMLQLARQINDKRREISLLEWLGYLKTDSAEYDSAIYFFEEGLKVCDEIKDTHSEILLRQGMTYLYDQTGENRKAIANNNETLKLALASGYENYLPALYLNNASNYLSLAEFDQVIINATKAIESGQQTGQLELYFRAYHHMAEAYRNLGDYRRAYDNQKKFTELSREILDERKSQQMNELQTKYETEKKEAEIISLSQAAEIQSLQLQQQRNMLFGLGGLVILLMVGGVLIYRQRKLKEDQRLTEMELEDTRKRLILEQQSRASELKAIRSQMNPHFVFNALNSIQEYIMTNERKLAGKYLGKFADLMRIYLNHSQVKRVSLAQEVEALKLYMELETLRFEGDLEFRIVVDDEVDPNFEIPSLLLQPYVENAFKHGLLHKEGSKLLEIHFSEHQDYLRCEIIDNGIGRVRSAEINQMRNPKHQSFATAATKSRLELLNRDREQKINELIEDVLADDGSCAGTRVIVQIPLETE